MADERPQLKTNGDLPDEKLEKTFDAGPLDFQKLLEAHIRAVHGKNGKVTRIQCTTCPAEYPLDKKFWSNKNIRRIAFESDDQTCNRCLEEAKREVQENSRRYKGRRHLQDCPNGCKKCRRDPAILKKIGLEIKKGKIVRITDAQGKAVPSSARDGAVKLRILDAREKAAREEIEVVRVKRLRRGFDDIPCAWPANGNDQGDVRRRSSSDSHRVHVLAESS